MMTIYDFATKYKEKNLFNPPLEIGTTSIRTYIKENRDFLINEGIVSFSKKIRSENINIIKDERLYEILK